MQQYFFKEKVFGLSEKDLVVESEGNQTDISLKVFFKNGVQRVFSKYLGGIGDGVFITFNIRAENSDNKYEFIQEPFYKNLIKSKWKVYHNDKEIGIFVTKFGVTKDKMVAELTDHTITVSGGKLSKEKKILENEQEIGSVISSRFKMAEEHEIRLDENYDPALLIGLFHVHQTLLSTQ
ncbi:hypothetical protein F9U64_14355 [Gracilibacillus oryzae]|uniref:Tubby C-terminal domain-containing protein n=1 Tax=Gracilibacillus oryzae TaxID=1672701 RepID=A0A7C8L2K2_9BACI|nr:hypothetical protein [Gracilibacillus oryzae]KAB8130302.1 hypothetical protein F9U64_14355 [Gracilibacillus oryzae]